MRFSCAQEGRRAGSAAPGPLVQHRKRKPNLHRLVVNAVESSSTSTPPPVSVGIDLGTTNSVVAVVTAESGPFCVPVRGEETLLPSIVAFTKDEGNILIGEPAKAQAAANAENTFYSVKRFIGREFDDVEKELKGLAYKTASDENGAVVIKCKHHEDGEITPEEVSAYVLRELLDIVEACTDTVVDRAVISVPAYFDDEQRSATITAGKIAGLENVKLIREPIAAAFSYGIDLQGDHTVLVFDLGGGTFDVSILEVGDGVIEVLSTGGDPELGGDDWDAVIARYIEDKHLKPFGVDVADARIRANVRVIAERAKVKLSTSDKVSVRIPVGGPDGKGTSFTMTRQLLDELAADLYRRCRLPVDQACWQAGVDLGTVLEEHAKDVASQKAKRASKRGEMPDVEIVPKHRDPISEVLLVGGATRMPSIKQFVQNMTGLTPRESAVNPDEAVALGAAIHAGVLSGHIEDLVVLDIWQASLMRAFAMNQLKTDPMLVKKVFPEDDDSYKDMPEQELSDDDSGEIVPSDDEAKAVVH